MSSTDPAGGGSARRGRRRSGRSRRGSDGPAPGTPADDTPDADPESVARTIALRKLTAAPRTRAQLADALARGGVPDDVADATLDRFEELGLVDDAEFARSGRAQRQAGRGLARRALAYELRQRGRRRRPRPGGARRPRARRRARDRTRARPPPAAPERSPVPTRSSANARRGALLGMLARKGYGAGVAARAVREALARGSPVTTVGRPPSRPRTSSDLNGDSSHSLATPRSPVRIVRTYS